MMDPIFSYQDVPPKVSVIVPVYNVETYLRQCLDSILSQTLQDIEIICIDDGSTDGGPGILKEYAGRDPRIRVITKPNTGYGDSVNLGIKESKGDYIGIVEPDDYVERDMFQVLYSNAKEHDLDVSRCNYWFRRDNTDSDEPTDFSQVLQDTVLRPSDFKQVFYQPPSVWANIYRRKFLLDNDIRFLPTPGASYQDISFTFKAYSRAGRFMLSSRHLYHYRIHAGSSSSGAAAKVQCVRDEYQEIWKNASKENVFLILVLEFNGYMWLYRRLGKEDRKALMGLWDRDFHDGFERARQLTDRRFALLLLKAVLAHSYRLDHGKWMRRLYANRLTGRLLERMFRGE